MKENIGIKISSAATESKNVWDNNAACAYPSLFVKINASSANLIDPDLKPIPNLPTFPDTCSLSEKPNDNMVFNPDRVIPLPSSCTVITYFPSRTYASTSTFPAPHSRSCALSNNSANAPNAQTCDVAFDFNILGCDFECSITRALSFETFETIGDIVGSISSEVFTLLLGC